MSDTGNRIFKGSHEGGSAQFAVIEANEFDLTTWTSTTTNSNIYNAIAANPKAKILINGALFNYKDEVFTTTGIVYNNGTKLATSTDPSKRSHTVAGLRYWLGQTTDNSLAANGATGASYQFGGKGNPPVPLAVPGPTDVHSSVGGMISCIWPDASGNGQRVTAAMDTDLKTYSGVQGNFTGWGIIGIDRATGMMIILSKKHRDLLNMFDVQNALWSSGVDQAVLTDGGTSVALAIEGSTVVKGGRHFGNSDSFNTVTNYLAFTPLPVAKIISPAASSNLTAGITIAVTAEAKGGTGNITKVEFFQGANKVGEDIAAPFTVMFVPTALGASVISAKVFDDDGGSAKSIDIPVTIVP